MPVPPVWLQQVTAHAVARKPEACWTPPHTAHLVVLLLLNQVKCYCQLLHFIWTDVWAVREPKVQDIEFAKQVVLRERLAILICQREGSAN